MKDSCQLSVWWIFIMQGESYTQAERDTYTLTDALVEDRR